ncbi:MAG: aminotransferase class V-fold PLP-dependent enzyme [Opitutales bacterium]
MTIEALQADETLRRELFPVAANEIFLANAAVCSLPGPVAQAMADYALSATQGDQEVRFPITLFSEVRHRAAQLLGVQPADIAIVGPTSVGLSLIANGLPWEAGDNVVFPPDDYPSNAVVWMNLEKRGVELRPIVPETPGVITLEDVQAKVDAKTRLVALSSAHFISGFRLEVATIGRWLKEADVLFSLDAIQTLGALHTPLDFVDFAPADAHKWFLGPCGTGLLYVSERGRAVLEPTLLGWSNVECPDFVTPETIAFKADARRYEAGSQGLVGVVGLHTALELLLDFGLADMEATILGHTRRIRESLREMEFELACQDDRQLSGITSFRKEGVDLAALHQKLRENGVTASLRSTRDRRKWIRFAPHCFNTRAEIDTALALLMS